MNDPRDRKIAKLTKANNELYTLLKGVCAKLGPDGHKVLAEAEKIGEATNLKGPDPAALAQACREGRLVLED